MKPWWTRLARYGFTERRSLGAIGLLMVASVGFGLLRPWPLKLIIDHLLAARPLPRGMAWLYAFPGGSSAYGLLAWLAGATVLLFLGGWLFRTAEGYLSSGAGSRMVHILGADLFHRLQQLSLRFHGHQTTGDLVKRITSDTACVRQLMFGVLLPALTSVVTLAGMLVIMWRLDPSLALVSLLVTPLLAGGIWFFARPMSQRTYLQYELQGAVSARAEQVLTALPIVRCFSREDYESEQFSQLWQESDNAYLKTILSQLQFKISTGAVTALGTALVFAIGGIHVLGGTLTVGSLLVFLSYLASLYSPLETLAYLSTSFAAASAGARRVFEILDSTDSVPEKPQAIMLPASPPAGAHLRIENVSFGYESDRPVLKEVNLEARPGEIIALVGRTGAGKSTLVSLIPRFIDPWTGRVTFDGVDVREVKVASLRSMISILLQEPFLFPLSIAENIAYSRPEASREEIIAAATSASADEFIRQLPNGYDTVVGERGLTLSGGQRQRLALARAFLRNAPVLILDEPTSALDAETERLLLEAMQRLMRGRTVFIIAHRLSTVQRADRIVVLEEGCVVESGTHSELLDQQRHYRRFHDLQFGGGGL